MSTRGTVDVRKGEWNGRTEKKRKGNRDTLKQDVATEKREWRNITLTPTACLVLHTVPLKNRGWCREGGMEKKMSRVIGDWKKRANCLPAGRKSFPGLWPTSLSLPAMKKWKGGRDGWMKRKNEAERVRRREGKLTETAGYWWLLHQFVWQGEKIWQK